MAEGVGWGREGGSIQRGKKEDEAQKGPNLIRMNALSKESRKTNTNFPNMFGISGE